MKDSEMNKNIQPVATAKKEIIDHLRNIQKSAEIESKVNGINLWVLIGAIAFVAWQIIDLETQLWRSPKVIWQIIVCVVLCDLLLVVLQPNKITAPDTRFSNWEKMHLDAPALIALNGLLFLIPSMLSFKYNGPSLAVVISMIMGLGVIVISAAHTREQLKQDNESGNKFPRPEFVTVGKPALVIKVIIGVSLCVGLIDQLPTLFASLHAMTKPDLKAAILVAVIYSLILFLFARKIDIHKNTWTYELETFLLLDIITPEAALRKIEHRALGPSLREVMDQHFESMETSLAALNYQMNGLKILLGEKSYGPDANIVDRSFKIKAAVEEPRILIEKILDEYLELSHYLSKISSSKTTVSQSLFPILNSLKQKNENFRARSMLAKEELDGVMKYVIM